MNEGILKLFRKPDTYKPEVQVDTSDLPVDIYSLVNTCNIQVRCYDDDGKNKNFTIYKFEDRKKLFPSYEGYIDTAISLVFCGGYSPNSLKLLQTQISTGELIGDIIVDWYKEHVEKLASVLFVTSENKQLYVEKLDREKINQLITYNLGLSESWNGDFAGLIYYSGSKEPKKKQKKPIKLDDEEIKQLILGGKYVKLTNYPDYWYIPLSNLVVLGKYEHIKKDCSIFDTDLSRQQYVLETLRVANDSLARDKAPPLLLKLKAQSKQDLARALGVNEKLLETAEGRKQFLVALKDKIYQARDSIAEMLLRNPTVGKVTILDESVFSGFEIIPVADYQKDIENINEMAGEVIANLLKMPKIVLGSKGDNWASVAPQLQFLQETQINFTIDKLNLKLAELSEKIGSKTKIELLKRDYTDIAGIA